MKSLLFLLLALHTLVAQAQKQICQLQIPAAHQPIQLLETAQGCYMLTHNTEKSQSFLWKITETNQLEELYLLPCKDLVSMIRPCGSGFVYTNQPKAKEAGILYKIESSGNLLWSKSFETNLTEGAQLQWMDLDVFGNEQIALMYRLQSPYNGTLYTQYMLMRLNEVGERKGDMYSTPQFHDSYPVGFSCNTVGDLLCFGTMKSGKARVILFKNDSKFSSLDHESLSRPMWCSWYEKEKFYGLLTDFKIVEFNQQYAYNTNINELLTKHELYDYTKTLFRSLNNGNTVFVRYSNSEYNSQLVFSKSNGELLEFFVLADNNGDTVKDICIDASKSGVWVLVGQSGAGKSSNKWKLALYR